MGGRAARGPGGRAASRPTASAVQYGARQPSQPSSCETTPIATPPPARPTPPNSPCANGDPPDSRTYELPAMNATPVPSPIRARETIASAGSGAISARALNETMTQSPTRPARRAPKRSLARPPGICIARCVTNSAVVKSPTTARPTPYERARCDGIAPRLATFQPVASPRAQPPRIARLKCARTRSSRPRSGSRARAQSGEARAAPARRAWSRPTRPSSEPPGSATRRPAPPARSRPRRRR